MIIILRLCPTEEQSLYIDGSTEAEQSGTLYLEDKALPTITVGSTIEIQ
ncbi:hypothetical protein [Macrococcus sp. DPC7161]|nr:hypothetical protein [Macrococcus sp. DPC7161]